MIVIIACLQPRPTAPGPTAAYKYLGQEFTNHHSICHLDHFLMYCSAFFITRGRKSLHNSSVNDCDQRLLTTPSNCPGPTAAYKYLGQEFTNHHSICHLDHFLAQRRALCLFHNMGRKSLHNSFAGVRNKSPRSRYQYFQRSTHS